MQCGVLSAVGNIFTRGQTIFTGLDTLVECWCPTVLVVERVHIAKAHRSYELYTFISALRSRAKSRWHITYVQVAAATWRASIIGNGRASKEQTLSVLRLRYPDLRERSSDELEAAAIGEFYVRQQQPAGQVEAALKRWGEAEWRVRAVRGPRQRA